MGVSRPAVLVAAYLMIFHHMTILEALMTIRKKRAIYPNDGFIKQLRELNEALLEDREYSDYEDDAKSQGSVIEASSIRVEEQDVESVMGAKVHSIMVEEEDTTSLMSSVMSKSSVVSKQPTLIDEDEEEKIYEEWRRKQGLPPRDISKKPNDQNPKLPDENEECDDYVKQMIYDWQNQNAKYQSLGPDNDDRSSFMGHTPSEFSDIESVTSQQILALKRQLESSGFNRGRSDSVSTDSTWDMWNERLKEIEKEAKAKADNRAKTKEKDVDEESIFSDTSSLFNFCKKNKNKLTALERWKIKRIQFGYHKKDLESTDGERKQENVGQKDEDETNKSDIDVKAYQEWKLKHQQKLGTENKEEIVEIAKGEDSATTKRRQRRVEIIERSKQTLEESQSMCGWETESSVNGSIPLTGFFPIVPSTSGHNDTASVLSMQSNRSALSQPRSISGQASVPVMPPNIPPGAGDAISIASIQNWIANVVSETIAQKQNEIMMMSRPSSVLNMPTGDGGRKVDDDKSSVLGAVGGSCLSGSALQHREFRSSDSVMSYNTSMTTNTDLSSAKRKITQTSVPLYGLFLDEVDLKKLNQKENEIREELSGKMSKYQKEKIVTCNKRSNAYRKKKAKENEDDEDKESLLSTKLPSYKSSLNRDYIKSDENSYKGYLASTGTTSELERNINKWLSDVKPEGRTGERNENKFHRKQDSEINGYGFSKEPTEAKGIARSSGESMRGSQRATSRFSTLPDEEEESSSFRISKSSSIEHFRESSPDLNVRDRLLYTTAMDNHNLGRHAQTHDREDPPDSDISETSYLDTRRKYLNNNGENEKEEEEENEDGLTESKYTTQIRSRYRKSKEEAGEMDDDDVIAAWRSRQEETKTKLRRYRKDN